MFWQTDYPKLLAQHEVQLQEGPGIPEMDH